MRTFAEVKRCFWAGSKLEIKNKPDVKILSIDEPSYRTATKTVRAILAHKDNSGFTWTDTIKIRDIVSRF
jgi:hypothetical protein